MFEQSKAPACNQGDRFFHTTVAKYLRGKTLARRVGSNVYCQLVIVNAIFAHCGGQSGTRFSLRRARFRGGQLLRFPLFRVCRSLLESAAATSAAYPLRSEGE